MFVLPEIDTSLIYKQLCINLNVARIINVMAFSLLFLWFSDTQPVTFCGHVVECSASSGRSDNQLRTIQQLPGAHSTQNEAI